MLGQMMSTMWRSVLCFVVYAAVAVLGDNEEQAKVVKTASGAVRGFLSEESGVYEFLNIPYATAPTGPNKFKAPLPPPVWHGVVDAVDTGILCPQFHINRLNGNKTMDENCLLVSVLTPDTTQKRLPVLVYIHGGAFQIGNGNWAKPTGLVKEHNIIAVVFNYRLGAHGFLCLGTEDVPGNAGMKDQVALLRWVRENIASFGGNPNDVTLAGVDAGAESVELMVLSKLARGLFNKIIPESGAVFSPYAIQSDPLENARWFAEHLKFEKAHDIDALEDFYKTLPFEQLNTRAGLFRTDSNIFSPCVELFQSNSSEVFLDETPMEIMRKSSYKKVPSLYGFATMDGLLKLFYFKKWKKQMNKKFSDFLPGNLMFDSNEEKEEVAERVKEFYFGNNTIDNNSVLSYANYFTDILTAYPIMRSVSSQIENGNDQVYLYEFTYVDEQTPAVPFSKFRGAEWHGQTKAVMGGNKPNGKHRRITKKHEKMASKVRHIWANFIKTGKPVPEVSELTPWPPVSSQSSPYMSLGNEFQLIDSPLLEERMAHWEDIYKEHYREPIAPKLLFIEYEYNEF